MDQAKFDRLIELEAIAQGERASAAFGATFELRAHARRRLATTEAELKAGIRAMNLAELRVFHTYRITNKLTQASHDQETNTP